MKRKLAIKIAVDALMTLDLFLLMSYHLWGEVAHEWLGAGMFVLFLLHHGLNVNWYGALFKGKYSPQRVFQTALDSLLCLDMLAIIISGVMMSRHVFAFLGLNGGMALARQMHLAGSYWGFVLMSMHLGLHWNMIMSMARKIAKRKMPSPLRIVVVGVAACGLWAFIRRDFPTYLLLQTHFVFFDFSEPAVLFILDYLAIMGLFVAASYYLSKALRGRSKKAKTVEGDDK